MLSFNWICPENMTLLCEGQTDNTLYVPFNRIGLVPLNFSTIYTFGVKITWHKPDKTNETRYESVQV